MMKYNKLFLILALATLLFASCKKDHYDTGNVHGVNAEGEVLLPIGSASFSLSEMIDKFKIDSIITCSEDGDLSFGIHYENLGALSGENLLKFKDLEYYEHFSFENPFPIVLPQAFDTVFHFDHTITFESDNIHVMEAMMKTGHFDFNLNSNIGLIQKMVIRTADIKDADGHDLVLDFDFNAGEIQFDLDGLHYSTDTANTLDLSYDLYVRLQSLLEHELYLDVDITGKDLAIKEMSGYVDAYDSRNTIDTTYNLLSGNVSGSLEVFGARLDLYERNTFDLEARLTVDTAWVFDDASVPYSIFGPEPLVVDVPTQFQFGKVLEKSLNGKISANTLGVFAVSCFTVNPFGLNDLVSVNDSCVIDVMVDAEIPFDFAVDDVRYIDTTVLNLSGVSKPEQNEKLTLELAFTSTIPLNMNAQFFTYDSVTEQITGVLVDEARLINGSFDGQPINTEVTLEVTGEKVENLLRSDRLISVYSLDTDAHDVVLNGQQQLDVFMKARVKYNGIVEFKTTE